MYVSEQVLFKTQQHSYCILFIWFSFLQRAKMLDLQSNKQLPSASYFFLYEACQI